MGRLHDKKAKSRLPVHVMKELKSFRILSAPDRYSGKEKYAFFAVISFQILSKDL